MKYLKRIYALNHFYTVDDKEFIEDVVSLYEAYEELGEERFRVHQKRLHNFVRSQLEIQNVLSIKVAKDRSYIMVVEYPVPARHYNWFSEGYDEIGYYLEMEANSVSLSKQEQKWLNIWLRTKKKRIQKKMKKKLFGNL